MLFRGSWRMMKWRQLFWMAFCAVKLSGTAADGPTDTPAPVSQATETALNGSVVPAGALSSTAPTPGIPAGTTGPVAASPSSPGVSTGQQSPQPSPQPSSQPSSQPSPQPSQAPTQPPSTHPQPEDASRGVPTTLSPTLHPDTTAATQPSTLTPLSSTAAPELTAVSGGTTQPRTAGSVTERITCHNVKEVSDTGAICLRLNESHTCKHFLETKGSDLWRAICEESTQSAPRPCQLKLASSEVDRECLLLLLDGDTDPVTDVLHESHWEKLGIKSLQRGSVRSHQDFSRKTLTALVTSGLLLAALGMAGYLLMWRRSWSPAGQRLDEDQYDLETGSQGSPAQEKPSANGAQGNGASRNGCGTAQRSLADTSM